MREYSIINLKNSRRMASWYVVFVTCLLVILGQLITLNNESIFPSCKISNFIRFLHLSLALLTLVFIFVKKRTWTPKLGMIAFIVLYLPYYFNIWFLHLALAAAKDGWIPFASFQFHFFILALLVPGSYWLNFTLMIGFIIEAFVLYLYLDIAQLPDVLLGTGPATTFLFGGVSLFLLIFRYRDEKIIKQLHLKRARGEVFENLARTFLSLRDRANTPLQTLKIATDILKKKLPEEDGTILIIENSVDRLSNISEILKKNKFRIKWEGKELMTDAEIVKWFSEVEEGSTLS